MISKPTRRVLFVDDDPQLLAGLGKALRKYRDRWTMVFADSGEAALAEVRRGTFDVVVSDMRMPAMDGATLLAHVRDHDPTTIRLILSGFSDHNAMIRARPFAHQFFNKPCDLRELSTEIERACELRELLRQHALRAVVARLGVMPPPSVFHQLAGLAGPPELGTEAIAAMLERDPALCEGMLQSVGAVFGPDRPMRTIAEAAARVGIEMLSGLALAAHAFALARDRGIPGASIAELQHHSLAVGRIARLRAGAEFVGDAFIAGLVHDIGKLFIAVAWPDAQLAIERRCERGEPRYTTERSLLGTSHGEVAAYVLWRWGLPLPIIDAVAHHDDAAAAATPVLTALRAAHAALR